MKHVVDANVFIHGRSPDFSEMVTAPGVMEEMKSESGKRSFSVTDVDVREPTGRAVEEVRTLSEEICSPTSDEDEKLVALASDVGGKIVSDDKPVQNLALHLDIQFQGFIEDSIEEKRKWKMVCPSCGLESKKKCSDCGKQPIRKQF